MALVKLELTLHFEITDRQQVEDALRLYILPLYQKAVVVNEGQANEERGYIEIALCNHDIGQPCPPPEARWEVGKGRVI